MNRGCEVTGTLRRPSASFLRRLSILGVCLLLLSLSSLSYGLEWGASVGVGVQWIGGSDWEKELSDAGMKESSSSHFLYGVFLRFPLFRALGVEFLLRPEMQVMTPQGSGSSATMQLEVSTRALHLPLSFEARYPLKLGAVYGFAGPSLNFFLTEIDYRMDSPNSVTEGSLIPYYGVVPGIVAGAGYCLPITVLNFQIEARYAHTLHKAFKDRDTTFGGVYLILGGYAPLPR